ncbi:MAG: hypothetical protein ACLGI6_06270 [Gammaproteobacteria bacterium]
MPNILTTNDVMMCPHGGSVMLASSQARAKAVQGQMLRASDSFSIVGCAFNISGSPHPCTTVSWQNPAQSVKAGGEAVLTSASIGLCKAADQAPQGTVLIQMTQTKVSAR